MEPTHYVLAIPSSGEGAPQWEGIQASSPADALEKYANSTGN